MNFQDKLSLFIDQFECAVKVIRKNECLPSYNRWCLDVSPELKFFAPIQEIGAQINPASLLLHGRKVNQRVFGIRKQKEYIGIRRSDYFYSQLENQFLFIPGILMKAFSQGFSNESTYTNIYNDDAAIAFDLGRHFLNKHIGIYLPYKIHPTLFNLK